MISYKAWIVDPLFLLFTAQAHHSLWKIHHFHIRSILIFAVKWSIFHIESENLVSCFNYHSFVVEMHEKWQVYRFKRETLRIRHMEEPIEMTRRIVRVNWINNWLKYISQRFFAFQLRRHMWGRRSFSIVHRMWWSMYTVLHCRQQTRWSPYENVENSLNLCKMSIQSEYRHMTKKLTISLGFTVNLGIFCTLIMSIFASIMDRIKVFPRFCLQNTKNGA